MTSVRPLSDCRPCNRMHTAPRRIHAARCRPLHASTGASTPGPAGAPDLPPLQRAPGPPGLPWLGQLPAYLATKFFPKKMLEWSEQYNGVYAMEIVGRKYLVVTGGCIEAACQGAEMWAQDDTGVRHLARGVALTRCSPGRCGFGCCPCHGLAPAAEPSLIAGIVGRGSAGLPKSTGYAMWDSAIRCGSGCGGGSLACMGHVQGLDS